MKGRYPVLLTGDYRKKGKDSKDLIMSAEEYSCNAIDITLASMMIDIQNVPTYNSDNIII